MFSFFLKSKDLLLFFQKIKTFLEREGRGGSKNNSKSFKNKSYHATGPYWHLILLFFLKKKTKINWKYEFTFTYPNKNIFRHEESK
jgi:hypothetical protein